MELRVVWVNEQDAVCVEEDDAAVIEKCMSAALTAEEFPFDAEVELIFTDNEGIRALNREQRGVDRATDVLSFPLLEQEDGGVVVYDEDFAEGRVLLGEIVLSLERAKCQAEEYGHSFRREIGFLAVHSILHLLGYDHELGEKQEKEMFARQDEILDIVGLVR